MTKQRLIGWLSALLVVGACVSEASAQKRRQSSGGGNFGLGLVLGEPSGITGKLFVSKRNALDFTLGVSSGVYSDHGHGQRFHMTYLWHPHVLAKNPTFSMPLYVGIGGFVANYNHDHGRDFDHDYTSIGPRAPIGLSMFFRNAPLELFFELAFAMDLFRAEEDGDRHHSAWLEGSLGLRYYF